MTSETNAEAPAKTSWLKRLLPIAVIIIGLGAAYAAGLHYYLSLETLREQRETLAAFVAENLFLAVLAYLVVYILATAFMVPGALWITIAGGFLFGLLGGSLATNIGATLGATALFLAARTSIGEPLKKRAGPFLKKLEDGFQDNAFSYMFFLRFMPVVPFPVANIAPALLGAKPRDFVFTTFFGIIPGVIAYTWIGAGLGGVFDRGEDLNLSDFFGQIAPPLAALAVVSLIPVVIKKFRKKPVIADAEA